MVVNLDRDRLGGPDVSKSLKLGDFGLAQVVSEPLFTVCGTPTYVAPEILAETGYGVKVDVWATGVIMYILLVGFPPFSSRTNNQEELFDQVITNYTNFIGPCGHFPCLIIDIIRLHYVVHIMNNHCLPARSYPASSSLTRLTGTTFHIQPRS